MSKAPSLSEDQKQAFESKFRSIVSKASKKVQDIWAKEGEIKWVDSEVLILPENFASKLTGKLAADFLKLENKRNNRTI